MPTQGGSEREGAPAYWVWALGKPPGSHLGQRLTIAGALILTSNSCWKADAVSLRWPQESAWSLGHAHAASPWITINSSSILDRHLCGFTEWPLCLGENKGRLTSKEYLNFHKRPRAKTQKQTRIGAALPRTEIPLTEACHHEAMPSSDYSFFE